MKINNTFIQISKPYLKIQHKCFVVMNQKNIIVPKNKNQQNIINDMINNDKFCYILNGPAGTGKTYISCSIALHLLLTKKYDKIILTRPSIPVNNEQFGYLPGSLKNKMDPWLSPIESIFYKQISKKRLQSLYDNGKIIVLPFAYMRGHTFDKTIVIADEMQNCVPSQMKLLLTRIGIDSKIFINGDVNQCDLPNHIQNGLNDIINRIQSYHNNNNSNNTIISLYTFENNEIVRNSNIEYIYKLYDHT